MLLLATDLDGTFLAGKSIYKQQLYRIMRDRQDILLIFVTGRGIETVIPLLNDPVIPNPHYIICDVGATVVNGLTLEPVQPIQAHIEEKWPGQLVVYNRLKQVRGLRRQEVPQMRRCSFFYDEDTALSDAQQICEQLNCDLLLSAGKFADILPRGINKGFTLKILIEKLGIHEQDVLVAGDTLNDLSLFQTGYKGVVVGQAEKKLTEATRDMPQVYQAVKPGCGGIIEALDYFEPFNGFFPEKEAVERTEQERGSQLLMVYHRLPYDIIESEGKKERVAPISPNGIIPSLLGFFSKGRTGTWIAWEETEDKNETLRNCYLDEKKYPNLLVSRIGMSKKDVELFYKVFSKEAFWPTIFSFIDRASFNHQHWDHFVHINRLFAMKVAAEADPGAAVWIHDYNLWMVPGILRQLRSDLTIAFFHHTSFPPADIFNIIPWRGEIIGSLLQCDYIGFHIPRYVENFVDVVRSQLPVKVEEEVNCTDRFLTYSCALGVEKMTRVFSAGGRRITVGAHPIGVNVDYIREVVQKEITQQQVRLFRKQSGSKKIILSVERLDYVKGPLEKIRAYQEFLEQNPAFHGQVELINICTPPAKGMKIYEKIQLELEQAIGKINGKFSRMDWVPIRFFFRSFSFEELVVYYNMADIAWITPLRDGLNLVAKEYVAVQGLRDDDAGVLLLSEFAGASVELKYAVLTNPYDRQSLKEGLVQALTMDKSARQLRMKRLFDAVNYYNINFWSEEFMREIEQVSQKEDQHDGPVSR